MHESSELITLIICVIHPLIPGKKMLSPNA
jgi:hypothetical protein